MAQILFELVDVLTEACAFVEEETGCAPSRKLEELIAHRICQLARSGERDPERLKAFAVEGLRRPERTDQ
jgi:hypothetical protein